jgi:hypothetical protein
MRKCDNAVVGEKLTHYESSVSGCIVIMEQPIACAPQFRPFSPNVLPQTVKNTAVELGVHGLAFGGKFKGHNPSNVKKHNKHALGRAAALPRLRSWGSWSLPLWRLLFSLGITPVGPTLVPSDEAAAKGSPLWQEWRRSSGNRRTSLARFENRTSSTRSSSGNGAGIGVSMHKRTILKGMLPKLKSSKYILVYRSSLGTFWYTLVYHPDPWHAPVAATSF